MIKSDYELAVEHSNNILQAGNSYTDTKLSSIYGSNMHGCSMGNALAGRINNAMTNFSSIVKRDGDNIYLLANAFKEQDENMRTDWLRGKV